MSNHNSYNHSFILFLLNHLWLDFPTARDLILRGPPSRLLGPLGRILGPSGRLQGPPGLLLRPPGLLQRPPDLISAGSEVFLLSVHDGVVMVIVPYGTAAQSLPN